MAGSFDKSEIVEFFLVEANEHLQNLNTGLLALEKEPGNRSMIDELFRAAHTLKGSAAMMGFQGISDIAHKAEDMLGQLRSGSAPICKETLNFLFDSVDAVKLMVEGVAAQKPEDALLVEGIGQLYKDVLAGLRAAPAPRPAEPKPATAPPPPSPPRAAAPAPQAPAKPAAPPRDKDDIDLAWEQTFDMAGSAPRDEAISVEPLEEEQTGDAIEVEPMGQEAPDEAISVEPLPEEPEPVAAAAPAHPASPPSPAPAVAAPEQQQPPAAAVGPAAVPEPAALKQEIEDAKRSGMVEKRGLGRRATDAPDVEKQFIRVNIERLDNLMNLVGELVVNRNRLVQQVEFIKSVREELTFSQKRLLHEVKKFEEKYEYTLMLGGPAQAQPAVAQTPSHDFLELEFDRYDDFNLLSRKLTEISNDTNEIMTELAGFFDTFELDTSKISTITTMLQGEITQARMVEMDRLFQLLQRPVRDASQTENKQVNLVVLGGDTKIDKTIFEIISDPMMHMVRNAVAHGIETAETRTKRGKDPVGTLLLNARHEGNNIVIEVEDDGNGMDPAVLRKSAVEKGFLSGAEAQALADLDVINLIFRPGFSTAQSVGKISGRGVGMDVVSNQLAKINGRIEIATAAGVGTKFTIRLPLTLVISQALIVKVRDEEMAIPMSLLEETTRFSNKDIQRVAGEEMVNLRGTLLRMLRLNEILGLGKLPKKDESFRFPTLILGMAEKRLALMVEDIVGREEIVVKSLGEYLKGVRTFSGATISGDGNVRLIINVNTLIGEERAGAKTGTLAARPVIAAAAAAAAGVPAAGPAGPRRKPRVLVVDDSISIRKFVQRFLDRTGYEVEVAADGMAALETMGKAKFDVVITDLEMPVMHGYDLMAEMKRNAALAAIPVIVLTSRAGDKHRQKAIELGAQDYLVKPFEEQEMIGSLKKVLSGATLATPA